MSRSKNPRLFRMLRVDVGSLTRQRYPRIWKWKRHQRGTSRESLRGILIYNEQTQISILASIPRASREFVA